LLTTTHRIFQITEFDACPRKPCNNGYYPIHEAAKNASSKTMEVFFQASFPFPRTVGTRASCMQSFSQPITMSSHPALILLWKLSPSDFRPICLIPFI